MEWQSTVYSCSWWGLGHRQSPALVPTCVHQIWHFSIDHSSFGLLVSYSAPLCSWYFLDILISLELSYLFKHVFCFYLNFLFLAGRQKHSKMEKSTMTGREREGQSSAWSGRKCMCALAWKGIAKTHSCSRTTAITRTPLQRLQSNAVSNFSSFVVVKDLLKVYLFLLFIYWVY